MDTTYYETLDEPRAAWGAVASMALCIAVVIASEFMPVSLLTPIAGDLGITEGQVGQAIAMSGLFAVVTSFGLAGSSLGLRPYQGTQLPTEIEA